MTTKELIVETREITPYKMEMVIRGGIGLTTLSISRAKEHETHLVKKTEFVFRTEELKILRGMIDEFMSSLEV